MTELGRKYVDSITDFAGVATARTIYLYDTPSVRLERADENGRPEQEWFSEERLTESPAQKVVGIR